MTFSIDKFDSKEMNKFLSFLRVVLLDETDGGLAALEQIKSQQIKNKSTEVAPLSSKNEKKVLDMFQEELLYLYNRYTNSRESDIETLKRDDLS